MIQLQRIIMGLQMGSTPEYQPRIEELFNRVLFPLLDDLLKPQTFQRDPQGMSETRLRASALLCKTFMHFEMREALAQSDIRVLWIQILDLLDRLMNIDKQDQLVSYVVLLDGYFKLIIVLVRGCAGVVEKRPLSHECCQCSRASLNGRHSGRASAFTVGSDAGANRPLLAGILDRGHPNTRASACNRNHYRDCADNIVTSHCSLL